MVMAFAVGCWGGVGVVVNLVVGGWRERRYIRNMDWIRNLNLHMLLTDMLDLSMAFLLIIHFFHHPMLSLTPAQESYFW